jgi:hypothetical protein
MTWTREAEEAERRRVKDAMQEARAVFVFGSNAAGVHGAGGAADACRLYGARWGQGFGFAGRSFAIPTRTAAIYVSRPLADIATDVSLFLDYAREALTLTFVVTRIGCGNAGYSDEEMAPLFRDAPANCRLPDRWEDILRSSRSPHGASPEHTEADS